MFSACDRRHMNRNAMHDASGSSDAAPFRRAQLAQQCSEILLIPMPPEGQVDYLGICQDRAQDILRADLDALSNNRVRLLLDSSRQVLEQRESPRSDRFADAAWAFIRFATTACKGDQSRWSREPWCIPHTVTVEDRPVVILDNKDWINLSQPKWGDHLENLKAWASNGAQFPVTHTVFEELCDGSSERQRRRIAETIEVLGDLTFVHDSATVWVHEVEAALTKFVGSDVMSAMPIGSVPYVTDAFGLFGESAPNIRDMLEDHDVADRAFLEHPCRAGIVEEMQRQLPYDFAKRLLVSPPRTGVWSALLDNRLVPQYNKAVESYLEMDEHTRSLFLRRLASVIVVVSIKDLDVLTASCMARGQTVVDVLKMDDDSYGNTILNVMPSLDALVTLSTELIKQGREVTRNDLQDIRHLAATVPYADFVMTDKRMMRLFQTSGLGRKARAKVLYSLDALVAEHDGLH